MKDNTREEYIRAELTVTEFSEEDVITTSYYKLDEYEVDFI